VRARDRARTRLAELAGLVDFLRRPAWRAGWAFNGQEFRRRLVTELLARVPFVAIVETGTSFGTTTRYLRQATHTPIYSFEADPRRFGFARASLRGSPDVHLRRCDSRAGLAALAKSGALPAGPVFFYLDAHGLRHGGGDLPLAEEIALASGHWPAAVIMIDDFCVPDDTGYGFDDYGIGHSLTLAYLRAHDLLPAGVWFPRSPSLEETGARRGCVVLAQAADLIQRIETVTTLRRWVDGDGGPAADVPRSCGV
jgi:hypothetical protein